MRKFKRYILSFLIGFHIMLRLLFSNTLTNDEITTETSNNNITQNEYAAFILNKPTAQKLLENDEFSIKKSDFASLKVQ